MVPFNVPPQVPVTAAELAAAGVTWNCLVCPDVTETAVDGLIKPLPVLDGVTVYVGAAACVVEVKSNWVVPPIVRVLVVAVPGVAALRCCMQR